MENFDKFEFNNFKYLINYSSERNLAEITHNKGTPDFLYKFYSVSQYSIEALTESYLYASHPIELNDILDSSPLLVYTSRPIDLKYYKHFYGESIFETEDELIKYWEEDVDKKQCQGYLNHAYNMAFNLMGIISLTAKENNTLMWPHYTQEKGFQIKFKSQNIIKSITEKLKEDDGELVGFFPINYVNQLKPIDVSPFRSFHIPFAYASNVKSSEWKYEEEWRIIACKANMGIPYSKAGLNIIPDHVTDKKNRQIRYDFTDIEEICFGFNFINARDFEIVWINEKEFTAKPLKGKSNWESKNILKLLNLISDKLADKLYYSGLKYELDSNNEPFIIRTKEKLEIKKIDLEKFCFKRTNEIIKLINQYE